MEGVRITVGVLASGQENKYHRYSGLEDMRMRD